MPTKDSEKHADAAAEAAEGENPPEVARVVRYKKTPLPLHQMIPLVIVILNESLCGTMLQPIIGFYVAHLQGVEPDQAGYTSGLIVSVFMFGQVCTGSTWGAISDRYGRRFPLISGLFTSGLFMLGFGFASNIWIAILFRFLQGCFNGNVLVAKTMVADITDKTNQAQGFSLTSFASGIGFLIGPALGGMLYDPANSSVISWMGFSPDGYFSSHPALLPSIVMFLYSIVGMIVCTLFVKESNPDAQPLPPLLRMLYPCMWYEVEPFVRAPLVEESDNDADSGATPVSMEGLNQQGPRLRQRPGTNRDTRNASLVDSLMDRSLLQQLASPCAAEDARLYDFLIVQERLSRLGAGGPGDSVCSDSRGPSRPASVCRGTADAKSRSATTKREGSVAAEHSTSPNSPLDGAAHAGAATTARDEASTPPKGSTPLDGQDGHDDHDGTAPPALSANTSDEADTSTSEEVTKFGYVEAFKRPVTRFMLSQYILLSWADRCFQECFPLLAIASPYNYGMDLEPEAVGYILLFNSIPSFASNFLFAVVCKRYNDKMGMLRISAFFAGVFSLVFGLTSYLSSFWLRVVLVVICTSSMRFCASWSYTLNTMLTARSAPNGKVGAIMGINQSCGALARGFAPLMATPLFAWSLEGEHIPPFNQLLVFCITSLVLWFLCVRSYKIRTVGEDQLELV